MFVVAEWVWVGGEESRRVPESIESKWRLERAVTYAPLFRPPWEI